MSEDNSGASLRCDECGCSYLAYFDNHDIGEPNWCCASCEWENSRGENEPKPEHTCIKLWQTPEIK